MHRSGPTSQMQLLLLMKYVREREGEREGERERMSERDREIETYRRSFSCQPPLEPRGRSHRRRGEETAVTAAGSGVLGAPRRLGCLHTSPCRRSSLPSREAASVGGRGGVVSGRRPPQEKRGAVREEAAGGEERRGARRPPEEKRGAVR